MILYVWSVDNRDRREWRKARIFFYEKDNIEMITKARNYYKSYGFCTCLVKRG